MKSDLVVLSYCFAANDVVSCGGHRLYVVVRS